jgi:cathepsin A (carboxypeptidase C)
MVEWRQDLSHLRSRRELILIGPGCSSLAGLFMELGPSTVDKTGTKPIHNRHSWNSNASVIFLDQPLNVGYSYGDDPVSDTVAASKDVYALLVLFFKQFPQYSRLEFHIAGESYAGHYIPVFASGIPRIQRFNRLYRYSCPSK